MHAGATTGLRRGLDALYARYNHRDHVGEDPVGFVHGYADPREREIVALIASCLAYGRVGLIHRSVRDVLTRMGPPRAFLESATRRTLLQAFADFRHRWTNGRDVALLLFAAKGAVARHGSLQDCFMAGLDPAHETVETALIRFCRALTDLGAGEANSLLACPSKGSACKRLNLFLRWLVRDDAIDTGDWRAVGPHRLLIPLDTHMFRLARALGLTRRSQADLRAVREVTEAFRAVLPEDPVRYDFALTRRAITEGADTARLAATLCEGPAGGRR